MKNITDQMVDSKLPHASFWNILSDKKRFKKEIRYKFQDFPLEEIVDSQGSENPPSIFDQEAINMGVLGGFIYEQITNTYKNQPNSPNYDASSYPGKQSTQKVAYQTSLLIETIDRYIKFINPSNTANNEKETVTYLLNEFMNKPETEFITSPLQKVMNDLDEELSQIQRHKVKEEIYFKLEQIYELKVQAEKEKTYSNIESYGRARFEFLAYIANQFAPTPNEEKTESIKLFGAYQEIKNTIINSPSKSEIYTKEGKKVDRNAALTDSKELRKNAYKLMNKPDKKSYENLDLILNLIIGNMKLYNYSPTTQ